MFVEGGGGATCYGTMAQWPVQAWWWEHNKHSVSLIATRAFIVGRRCVRNTSSVVRAGCSRVQSVCLGFNSQLRRHRKLLCMLYTPSVRLPPRSAAVDTY